MQERLLRLKQIIGSEKQNIPPIIFCSESTWWAGVANGRFPKPIKHGRMSFWRESDIKKLME